MNKQGYIEYNLLLSSNNSGKADSYARALKIIEEILPHQDTIQLNGKSIFEISDIHIIESLENFIRLEVIKMKNNEKSIFDYGRPNQRSYPLKNFCSAALKSLKSYVQYEQEIKAADVIVEQENNPKQISKQLIAHFDLTKEGKDEIA